VDEIRMTARAHHVPPPPRPGKRGLRGLLGPLGDIREGELGTALLMATGAFLLLGAYYLLKVAREPVIITGAGPEWKVYSYALQLALLVVAVRIYAFLCAHLGRIQLITAVMSFFALCLAVFHGTVSSDRTVGIAFYVWVGVFNVTTVAQFWALAADVYDREQGERLFAFLGTGAALGGVVGSYGARWLVGPLGAHRLMLVALVLVAAYVAVVWAVHGRERRRHLGQLAVQESMGGGRTDHDDPIGGSEMLELFRSDRYLVLIGALTLVLNAVGTIGEYVLDRQLLAAARQAVAERTGSGLTVQTYIATFRGSFFAAVNLLALVLQVFAVPRLIRHLGVGRVLLLVPIVALLGYASVALLPVITVITLAKVLENSGTHSVEKTAREALFLIASREAKYKARTVVDTLFWRGGDVLAAAIVWVGSARGLPLGAFVAINVFLAIVWVDLTLRVTRLHRQRTGALPTRVALPRPLLATVFP
jgi:AAA family ATP:ADP antiporter